MITNNELLNDERQEKEMQMKNEIREYVEKNVKVS